MTSIEGSPAVLIAEASGIQDWILGSGAELRVIRGGSLLLDQAFDGARQVLFNQLGDPVPATSWSASRNLWTLPVAASGSMTALFGSGQDAHRAAELLRSHFATALPGLRVDVGVAAVGDAEHVGISRAAARRSVLHQAAAPAPSRYVTGAETCTACGTGAASGRQTLHGWNLCATCERRAGVVDETQELVVGVRQEYRVEQLGDATPARRWKGYIGVVCLDGNGIGRVMGRARSPGDLEDASRRVHEGVDGALRALLEVAVRAHRHITSSNAEVPVNVLMRAGDDVRLILPAHLALHAALAYVRHDPNLPASAGVLLCHRQMPFVTAHHHAERLLGTAKRAAREADPEAPGAYVGFAVESSASVGADVGEDPLSASPYAAAGLDTLLDVVPKLHVASSAIRGLMKDLRSGGRVAERAWQLFRHRLDDDDRARLDRLLGGLGTTDVSTPWSSPRSRGPCSPLGDVLLARGLAEAA